MRLFDADARRRAALAPQPDGPSETSVPCEDLHPTARQVLHHPWNTLVRVVRHWAGVSTLCGSASTVFDLGLVIVLVQFFHFNPVVAAPIGVCFGSAVNFTLNRLFAFKDSRGHVLAQALRFAAGTLVAASVHAGVVYLLTERLHVYYVISKFVADILVFTGGNLLLYRYLVFPKTHELPR